MNNLKVNLETDTRQLKKILLTETHLNKCVFDIQHVLVTNTTLVITKN